MAITRTAWTDDDGSGTTGTVLNNAVKTELYNQIDAEVIGAVVTSTVTGAQNNWAPGLAGHTLVEWNGAADAAFTGLATGVSGQRVTVKNITTTKVATFAHNSGSSSAANRCVNIATSGPTPIAAGGSVTYQHDGTSWQLIAHEQGAWITPAYAGGDYTASAGTWTVDSGDVVACSYRLNGRTLSFRLFVTATSVSATPANLMRVLPGGFTCATRVDIAPALRSDNGAAYAPAGAVIPAGGLIAFYVNPTQAGTWTASTNATQVIADFPDIEVT